MDKQKTITKEVTAKGVGLHTAHKVSITFKPAPVDSGITFVRVDIPGKTQVRVSADTLLPVSRSPRRTSIGKDGAEVHTIEHLMATLAGIGIDNLVVELDNDEVPGLDGSSLDFLSLFEKAGLQEQEKERRFFSIKEPICIEEGDASIIAMPSPECKISYTLSYGDHPILNTQFLQMTVNTDTYRKEIAPARTFCLEEEADLLQQQGVGGGASYDNTLVVGKAGVIKNKLRFKDEFIRHKILDLVGDLYSIGQPIKAHVIALKSGHSLNMKLAMKIHEQIKRYSLGGIGVNYHPREGELIDSETIMKILPHREPFLFVDRIVHLEQGKRAIGLKNVTINDYFFRGHFPGKPVMPGVIILEAMAQVGGVMMLSPEENRGKLAYFMAANNVKFRKTVIPGDQLVFEVTVGKIKSKTGQVFAKAYVDGKVVTEAEFMFALVDG
jgi:UDP-3-O-[3-hydroxymyristoyl] N-acetylglucosamine deacetylase/3-hydroxyacyl-[acyl-carrier-protein] dehydratase